MFFTVKWLGFASLAMTSRAVCFALQLMFLGQLLTIEINRLALSNLCHGLGDKHILVWSNVFLWISMTVQAPPHRQWLDATRQWHIADIAMATVAADAFVDMNAVVEIYVVR